MKTHWGCAVAAALLVLAGGPGPASAQDSPPASKESRPPDGEPPASDASSPPSQPAARPSKVNFKKAKRHYVAATRALGNSEFIFAAKQFFAAYEITKDPILFFKIGLSHDMAGDCGAASIFYRRYLDEARPTGDERADAEKRLATCDAKLGPVSRETPDPAAPVEPGARGAAPLDVPELDQETVEPAEPVEEDSDVYRPSVGKTTVLQTVAWTTIGGAAAAATAAAVLSISANARQEDLEDLLAVPATGERAPFEGSTREQYEDFVDDGERLQTMAYIAWGVAGAAATTAIVLLIVDAGDSGDGGESAASTMVVPTAGPNGAVGLSASWEF